MPIGYKSEEELKVQRILLDVVRLNMSRRVDKEMMFNPLNTNFHVEEVLSRIGKDMIIRLEQKVASQALDVIKFQKPASWWQHWKEEKASKWFVKKYPVKYVYEEYKVSALFPKLAIQDGQHVIQVYKMGDDSWQ